MNDGPSGSSPSSSETTSAAGKAPLHRVEFIALMALMMMTFPLALDVVLPALLVIGRDLGVTHDNDSQLIIAVVILGMAVGQVFYGPLSDAIGRKPAIYIGMALYLAGSVVCLTTDDFIVMLGGRLLQGLGTAGARIVAVALIRDQYGGAAMARIMSFVIVVLMVGPLVAPFLGQGIILIAPWRALFFILLAVGVIVCLWLGLRQPETLPRERRLPFTLGAMAAAMIEAGRSRLAMGYTIAAGITFGEMFAFVISSPQIFLGQYQVGALYPFYVMASGIAVAVASVFNANLVMRLGMARLCRGAVIAKGLLAAGFLVPVALSGGTPPLWATLLYLPAVFFCAGILFGNLNARAMEYLGHIAGAASGVIGTLTFLLAMILATGISRAYDGTMVPLIAGMAILSACSLTAIVWAERDTRRGVTGGHDREK